MRTYRHTDAPLEVHGILNFKETGKIGRVPKEVLEELKIENPESCIPSMADRTPGARVCFRTNSKKLTVRFEFETLNMDYGMSLFICQSLTVMVGPRKSARMLGVVSPRDYNTMKVEETFEKSGEMEEVTLWFPRSEPVKYIEVDIDDDAEIEVPTPYKYPAMLYYGSSITEGGCAHMTGIYSAIISNDLDVDFYNCGFSGSARGELCIARWLADIPASIFVYDYDFNAPTPEYLKKTHEPFFKVIREKNPDLPIVMITRPTYYPNEESDIRADIIRTTYDNAVKAGDKNVWFIDGRNFFGDMGALCTIEGIHPNELGFWKMAQVIEPVIKQILVDRYGE